MLHLILVLVSVVGAWGEELTARASIRFPSDDFPALPSPPGAHEIYQTAESQSSPVVTNVQNPVVGQSHYLVPQNPSKGNPFGELNEKGFAQGFILTDHFPIPPLRQETHQPVSDYHQNQPLKAVTYGPPRVIPMVTRTKPTPPPPYRIPERHRFAPPPTRYIPHQYVPKAQFTQTKPLFVPKPLKDNKSQLSEAIYKYAVVSQKEAPINKPQVFPPYMIPKPDFHREPEIPIVKGHPSQNPYESFPPYFKFQKPQKFPKESFPEHFPIDEDKYTVKKPFLQAEESKYPIYVKENKQPPKKYPEYPEYVKPVKHYVPLKEVSNDYYISDPEDKPRDLEPTYDNQPYFNPDFNTPRPFPQPTFDDFSADKSGGSDWTPINAPEGAVPAKAYELPAPDLSQYYPRSPLYGKVEDERPPQRPSEPLVKKYSKNGNSEEVVSAVVMVKQ